MKRRVFASFCAGYAVVATGEAHYFLQGPTVVLALLTAIVSYVVLDKLSRLMAEERARIDARTTDPSPDGRPRP